VFSLGAVVDEAVLFEDPDKFLIVSRADRGHQAYASVMVSWSTETNSGARQTVGFVLVAGFLEDLVERAHICARREASATASRIFLRACSPVPPQFERSNARKRRQDLSAGSDLPDWFKPRLPLQLTPCSFNKSSPVCAARAVFCSTPNRRRFLALFNHVPQSVVPKL